MLPIDTAEDLRVAINTADTAIRNGIRDGTIITVIPQLKRTFVRVSDLPLSR
jgi:hypothetical protein